MDEQEKRLELHRRLAEERPVLWDNLPDISLYMDQVISYLPRQLIRFGEGEQLTSAMVNNYSKEGLIPRADGKKYGRTHLVYLSAICALKQVLSVREIRTLLSATGGGSDSEEFYTRFCAVLDTALTGTADKVTTTNSSEELSLLALELALESYANKLACQRILDMMQEQKSKPEKGKK
jgi:hypothetical protein